MTAQELKNSILQLAVEGKLVPHTNENASELLEKIKAEKAKLIAEGKINDSSSRANNLSSRAKSRDLPPIAEDEKPFDIPENWCWCRLGEIFSTSSGTTPASKNPEYYNNGTVNWVRTTDLNNSILSSTEIKITEKAKIDCNLKIIPQDSVCIALYGGGGTIGKNALIKFDTTINQSVCAIHPNGFCDMNFVQLFMQWQRPNWMSYASGSRKDPNINQIIVKNSLFPLPPLSEQKAIVAKIEELLPYIEKYDAAYTKLEEFNKEFPEDMQKSILQQAVQGKLVSQDKADGNAKDLLAQIKAEKAKLIADGKIKKEKALAEITEDEIPFDIPENWCWCRFEEIMYLLSSKNSQIKQSEILSEGKYPVISQSQNDIEGYYNDSCKLLKNPGIILVFGDHSRTIKIIDFDFIVGADGTQLIVPVGIDAKYFYYFIRYVIINLPEKSYGRHFSLLKACPVPLPPLTEQKRIVEKIEELLPLCKKLER